MRPNQICNPRNKLYMQKNKHVIGYNSRHLFMTVRKTYSRRKILKKLRTRWDFAKIVDDTISTDFNRYDILLVFSVYVKR